MSIWDSILSDTVGLPYRAFTGKPDPWTLNNIASDTATAQLQAQGLDPTDPNNATALDAATTSALADAQNVASTTGTPKVDCSQPSTDFLSGLYCTTKKFENIAIAIVIVLIIVYLGGKYLERKR